MQVIHPGIKPVSQLLCTDHVESGYYRSSICMLREDTTEGTLLCNTISGELVLINDKERSALEKLPESLSDELSELAKRRFVVPVSYEEIKVINQIRAIMEKMQGGSMKSYNILPTTHCNARCFYCYESDIPHHHMTPETAHKLVEYIVSDYRGKEISLSWFGGEPMLGRRIIDQICTELDQNNVIYRSTMISNGYLFDEDSAQHAAKAWKLHKIQITLDGTEEIYNASKAYVGISDSAFKHVLRNIHFLLDVGIYVSIRLNLGSHNLEDLKILVELLSDEFDGEDKLSVYEAVLRENMGFNPVPDPLSEEELKKAAAELGTLLYQKKLKKPDLKLPQIKVNFCMADSLCNLQCTPEGIFSKCEDRLYSSVVGNLDEGITDPSESARWREKLHYSECGQCPLIPGCILLKHCPTVYRNCNGRERPEEEKAQREKMVHFYQKWLERSRLKNEA